MVAAMGRARRILPLVLLTIYVVSSCGCTAAEAIVDGLYGGLSDTVSTIVSDAFLATTGLR